MSAYEESIINPEQRLHELYMQDLLPEQHIKYISSLKESGINPKVIYDIGSQVLHWTKKVKNNVWQNSKYFCFEAMHECESLYKENEINGYHLGVLTDIDNKEIQFYKSMVSPGGNSYYIENEEITKADYFGDFNKFQMIGMSLDTVVKKNNFPLPNFIKIDVQGAELDIVKGASICISHADHVILELQEVDFNVGAPKAKEVIEYMKTIGYEAINSPFCYGWCDADYHFKRIK
jgi:FkbM family methyltransferase